jgi:anaerobic magnesium-protoporphyrin IX monomethyl ester cyclase
MSSIKVLLTTPIPPYPKKLRESAYDPGDTIAPPLALAYLGAAIREAGIDVRIFDTILELYPTYRWQDLKSAMRSLEFDVVGISCLATVAYPNSLRLAHLCKWINPNAKVVLGGMFPTFMDKLPFQDSKDIDVVVRKEGEKTMVNLLHAFDKKKRLEDVKGITYRLDDNVRSNPDEAFFDNLDDIPAPAWDMYPRTLLKKISRGLPIMTSRGCPRSCAYCADKNFWQNEKYCVRYHSSSRIVSDITAIVDLGFDCFHVNDDTFTSNHKIVLDVCRRIEKEHIDVSWHADTRADAINTDVLQKMKKSGCTEVLIGIESGSQEILDRSKTKKNVNSIRNAVEILNKLDFSVIGTFMVGLPGETFETFAKTIRLLSALKLNVAGFYPFIPLPGCDIWENPEKYGIHILSKNWLKYLEPYVIIETEELSAKRIQALLLFARAFAFDYTESIFQHKNEDLIQLQERKNVYLLKEND